MALACVTGANSFLGRHLLDALLAQGWRVVALHRPGTRLDSKIRNGVEWVPADITAWKNVRAAMPMRPDAVFHTAYNTSLWRGDAENQTRLNVFGTRNVIRAAVETRARRFIHTSSVVAYGLHSGTNTEDTPSRAARCSINLVRSMAHGEREVRRGIRQGLEAVILNPAHMLGPHDPHAWGHILRLIQRRRVIAAPAGGGSFCHVQAVAQAHVRAFANGRAGHNYLLGGADVTYVKLLSALGGHLNRPTLPWPAPAGLLRGYARLQEITLPLLRRKPEITQDLIELLSAHTYCKSRKAITELGYEPKPLEEMLRDCRSWLSSSDGD